jgi:hypothetical protein
LGEGKCGTTVPFARRPRGCRQDQRPASGDERAVELRFGVRGRRTGSILLADMAFQ